MARISSIMKNNKRRELSNKHRLARKELRAKSIDPKLSPEEREAAFIKLQKMPRDGSPIRTITRCKISGRPRGNYRKFELSRIAFRQLALDGKLPGVTKASW